MKKRMKNSRRYWIIVLVLIILFGVVFITLKLKDVDGSFLFGKSPPADLSLKSIEKINSDILSLNEDLNKGFIFTRASKLKQLNQFSADRKNIMISLIKNDPQKAIDSSLAKERKNFPASVQGNIEEETEIQGAFYQVHADDFERGKLKMLYSVVDNKGKKTDIYFASDDYEYLSSEYDYGDQIKISGIKLDGFMAAPRPRNSTKPNELPSSIESFTLFDVSTNTDIRQINNGDVINATGKYLGIRANTNPATVNRVIFDVNAVDYKDTAAPYTYSLYNIGDYVINATPYTSKSPKSAGTSLSVSFNIFDDNKQPPKSPPTLSAIALSSSSIKLTWNDVSDETYYKLERSLLETTGFTEIVRPSANTVTYTDIGLNPTTTYYYRIRATNNYGDSSYSNVASATTATSSIPKAPSSLVATANSPFQITLTWTDNSNEEQGVRIERKTSTTDFAEIGTASANAISYADATVSADTAYTYRVRAYNVMGNSNYSNEASATTPPLTGKYPLTSIPQLSSNPSASAKLYLDFDGEPVSKWGSYSNIVTPAYDTDGDKLTFTDAELNNIKEMWTRVSEKYSVFNIDVTTIKSSGAKQVIIGGNGAWTGGTYGGVAYVGSFPVFVFEDNLGNGAPKYTAEASAHEAGHGFRLYHQKKYNADGSLSQEYYTGPGDGRAPIMGNSYSATRGLWWYGTSASATSYQDDLLILSSTSNGFGYKTDDYGNVISSATALSVSGTAPSGSGITEKTSDKDVFSFDTNGLINIQANTIPVGFTHDIKLLLLDSSGNTLQTSDPTTSFGASVTSTLSPGTYYISVESHGGYGDVGQYTVSGSVS